MLRASTLRWEVRGSLELRGSTHIFDMIQANLVSLTHLVLVDGLARM